ncbi:MAG: PBP1A family penicillin-binding protein [Acidobacteria bacterium]|nr:MAG: PBP1A family penicillin-binding protein [Acidobacteriota bacterium]
MDGPQLQPPKSPIRGGVAPLLRSRKFFGQLVLVILVVLAAGSGVLGGLLFVYSSDLPQVRLLEDYRPDVMTEVFADDGTPIARFAMQHRVLVTYGQIPPLVRNAVISVEDRNFESHWGIDVFRTIRAAITDILELRYAQGASTLTQQLARMLFLTPEKSPRRKIQEALLAIQIERRFTKPQIFTMYANQVPMGYGNYGFAAAAEFYFGKRLEQLTIPEAALLAGMARGPIYWPILHPRYALMRRNEVLKAMLSNGKISKAEYQTAARTPLDLHVRSWHENVAPYFVEDVRQFLQRKYGLEAVQQKGLRVYTTLSINMQRTAQEALRNGLRADDKRRGWRGPELNILKNPVRLPDGQQATLKSYQDSDWSDPMEAGSLVHGIVMDVNPHDAEVRFGELTAEVKPTDFKWTLRKDPRQVFSTGDVDVFKVEEIKGTTVHVTLDQTPDVQGALVALDNATGEIKAMVGGYNYETSQFNRAVQAYRQVGSSFKVYVYAQALLDGIGPFDTIMDSPVTFPSPAGLWAPHNYDGKFDGSMTLLHALAQSKNVPAVKLLAKVGVDNVIKLCRRFGIESRLVPNLPLALGASDLTLLEHTSAFSTFPDDGVHIDPREILRVTDYNGRVIDDFPPQVTDVLPAGISRIEISMLREVFNSGTAVASRGLARKYDLAGKTGTTNDFTDAWFLGFSPSITAGVWVGFDDHHSLGRGEEGSHVALPIWSDFMTEILKNKPVERFPGSPLLSNPGQVQQILASAGSSNILAGDSNPSALAASLSDTRPVSSIQQTSPTARPATNPSPTAQPPVIALPQSSPEPQAN